MTSKQRSHVARNLLYELSYSSDMAQNKGNRENTTGYRNVNF